MPDFLITDLAMPNIDGFQMLRSLVRQQAFDGMRIAVVTGLDASAIERAGGLPDSIAVFGKPVPFAELEQIANAILETGARFAVTERDG